MLVEILIVVKLFGTRVVEHIPASIDGDAFISIIVLCITTNIVMIGFVMSMLRVTVIVLIAVCFLCAHVIAVSCFVMVARIIVMMAMMSLVRKVKYM